MAHDGRNQIMRLSCLVFAAVLAGSLPAQAEWKEYTYADLGIAKYFPAAPKIESGTWGKGIRLPLSKLVPATILSAEDDGVLYTLTVADFSARAAESANIMGEAVSSLADKGEIVSQGLPRVDLGNESVYGVVLIVDEKKGDRVSSEVFFNKGRLYVVQASAPKGSPAAASAGIGRFIESVRFHMEGYGWDEKLGKPYPIGDDDPYDRDLGQKPALESKPEPAG
jgi:hypothetical protein